VNARTIYMRHTSAEGNSYVNEHRVWDADKFIASQQKSAEAINADHAKKNDGKAGKAKAEQITQEQYTKERTK
jgi:hypothetical protein